MSPNLRKDTWGLPSGRSLTNCAGPRVRGRTPASSPDVDHGWVNRSGFLLWLAPRFTPPIVIWVGVRSGIFMRLHGPAMEGNVMGRDDGRQEQVWKEC